MEKKLRCGFNIRKGKNLILKLCSASVKKTFVINGQNYKTRDGTTIRDYIHVEDLAKIHMSTANLLMKKKIFQTFNCGYGYGYSVKQILENLLSIQKIELNLKWVKEGQKI